MNDLETAKSDDLITSIPLSNGNAHSLQNEMLIRNDDESTRQRSRDSDRYSKNSIQNQLSEELTKIRAKSKQMLDIVNLNYDVEKRENFLNADVEKRENFLKYKKLEQQIDTMLDELQGLIKQRDDLLTQILPKKQHTTVLKEFLSGKCTDLQPKIQLIQEKITKVGENWNIWTGIWATDSLPTVNTQNGACKPVEMDGFIITEEKEWGNCFIYPYKDIYSQITSFPKDHCWAAYNMEGDEIAHEARPMKWGLQTCRKNGLKWLLKFYQDLSKGRVDQYL